MKNKFVIVDAHVHIYDRFNLENLFNVAYENFRQAARYVCEGIPWTAFMIWTEGEGKNQFQQLFSEIEADPERKMTIGKWVLWPTLEKCSLKAGITEETGLCIIAGKQIQTKENLEVLALGTTQNFAEKTSLEDLISQISRQGAIPVIPWGVGKWIGDRGKLVRKVLERGSLPPFFLGDNRNRPIFWPRPKQFKEIEKKGLSVLPGTDPLPFPSEFRQIGRFGFTLSGSIDPDYPFRDIRQLLLEGKVRPEAYGSLEKPWRFLGNQLRIKFRKDQP